MPLLAVYTCYDTVLVVCPPRYEVALLKGKRGLGAGFGTDWKRDMPLDSFQGLFVAELVAGGLAAQAGCVLPGDRLVQVNRELRQSGHRRPHMSHLVASVRDTEVGSTVYVESCRAPMPIPSVDACARVLRDGANRSSFVPLS